MRQLWGRIGGAVGEGAGERGSKMRGGGGANMWGMKEREAFDGNNF